MTNDNGQIRQFGTGATRDTSKNKLEPYGFISPLALFRFSEYMHKHRLQADNTLRSSDNWKKGMPIMVYVHSLIRHVFDFWLVMSGLRPRFDPKVMDPEEIACAILFNVQGFLHEVVQKGIDNPILEAGSAVRLEEIVKPDYRGHLARLNPILDREVEEAFSKMTDGASDDWREERAWA